MPMGLACAPRLFTKFMKPVYSFLRSNGFDSVAYIDDSLLIGSSPSECTLNVEATMKLLRSLGFYIKVEKSSFLPSTEIKYLGFIINSNTMKVYLPESKKSKIKDNCNDFLGTKSCFIQLLASFIGLLVSCFNAVEFGALQYRALGEIRFRLLGKILGGRMAGLVCPWMLLTILIGG